MASVFTHALVGLSLGQIYSGKKLPKRFWFFSILCTVFPDLDVLGFNYGIRYGDFLGHRGFSHSLFFAFLFSLMIVILFFRSQRKVSESLMLIFYFFLLTASHGFLDAVTNGGLGIAFFSPFDQTRYFFPWRPIQVSPLSIHSFFTSSGLKILSSEFFWIWIPAFASGLFLNMGGKIYCKYKRNT